MKTMSPARIQIVTSALHAYSLTLCKQYGARVRRQSMAVATSGRLFGFRMYTGMPTLGTIKNALRYARSVQQVASNLQWVENSAGRFLVEVTA